MQTCLGAGGNLRSWPQLHGFCWLWEMCFNTAVEKSNSALLFLLYIIKPVLVNRLIQAMIRAIDCEHNYFFKSLVDKFSSYGSVSGTSEVKLIMKLNNLNEILRQDHKHFLLKTFSVQFWDQKVLELPRLTAKLCRACRVFSNNFYHFSKIRELRDTSSLPRFRKLLQTLIYWWIVQNVLSLVFLRQKG